MQWSILVAVLALAGRASATLSVQDGKFSIVDSVSASIISSDSFSSSSPALIHEDEDRRPLSETDVLKLAFTVTRDGKPFQPQQASLVVVNPLHSGNSPRTAQFAIKVRPNSGKAKWDSASSPAIHTQLASLDATTVDLTLVVGHPHEPEPLQIHLGRIQLPPSFAAPTSDPSLLLLPKHWEAEKYAPQPEIVWTFRDGEKPINPIVALVGLAVVLAPWFVLLAAVSGPGAPGVVDILSYTLLTPAHAARSLASFRTDASPSPRVPRRSSSSPSSPSNPSQSSAGSTSSPSSTPSPTLPRSPPRAS